MPGVDCERLRQRRRSPFGIPPLKCPGQAEVAGGVLGIELDRLAKLFGGEGVVGFLESQLTPREPRRDIGRLLFLHRLVSSFQHPFGFESLAEQQVAQDEPAGGVGIPPRRLLDGSQHLLLEGAGLRVPATKPQGVATQPAKFKTLGELHQRRFVGRQRVGVTPQFQFAPQLQQSPPFERVLLPQGGGRLLEALLVLAGLKESLGSKGVSRRQRRGQQPCTGETQQPQAENRLAGSPMSRDAGRGERHSLRPSPGREGRDRERGGDDDANRVRHGEPLAAREQRSNGGCVWQGPSGDEVRSRTDRRQFA